ncbi:MAG: type IV secretory system conjugative DNA transfer family protein, partial [Chloroflexota bacterium]|nr:type IV secretory system conjugative DNA transfer family protein [Chloroflexota bacterium]
DLRETILGGGILLVSTAQGKVGRNVAALVGSSILNLVDAVIREQGSLPPDERRGALVVVDEMQTMPGVDYESMLSELGKFGASFILATQSLGKLEDLSRTMRDTVLANVGCLAAFQMAGTDARQLVWELGKERVSEDDVTSLDVHQCYVRATVGTERMDAFSMAVRPPEAGNPEAARRIREEALAYLTTAKDLELEESELQALRDRYRRELEELRRKQSGQQQSGQKKDGQQKNGQQSDGPPEEEAGGAEPQGPPRRNKPRSKRQGRDEGEQPEPAEPNEPSEPMEPTDEEEAEE